MKERIHGIVCDPAHATLIAERTNEEDIDKFSELRRFELYRDGSGHYFVQSELGTEISLELLSRTDARRLYDTMPEHKVEAQQAFAD